MGEPSWAYPAYGLPSSSGGVNVPRLRSATGLKPNKPPSFASCVAACGGDVTRTDDTLRQRARHHGSRRRAIPFT